MRVLFVGGTGTISTAAARACIEAGIDLSLLVRGTRDHRMPPEARVIHADVKRDPRGARLALAGQTWDAVVDWVMFDDEDVSRDVELFRGACRRFFFISSTSVYEKPLPSPHVNERTPTGNRFWAYADKKARCERRLLSEYRATGFPAVVVRPGHTYAEFALPTGFLGLGFGAIERILEGKPIVVHGDGTGLWTLTASDDCARALVPLFAREDVVGEAFQITSDELLTWNQIYEAMAAAVDRPASLVHVPSRVIASFDGELGASLLGDKAHCYLFDNAKIRLYVPAFVSKVSFSEGLARCLAWYRENGHTVRYSPESVKLMDEIAAAVGAAYARAGESQ
jgi:nucleoside-diphosphate-sugar epimerase